MIDLSDLETHGKPVAFYSDKHGIFRVNAAPKVASPTPRTSGTKMARARHCDAPGRQDVQAATSTTTISVASLAVMVTERSFRIATPSRAWAVTPLTEMAPLTGTK
jgi:hypothetical protein